MLTRIRKFLADESGNATIESLVVIGGSVWMAGVVLTDVSVATMGVTERLEHRLEYTSIVSDILSDYGTPTETASSGETADAEFCAGNPGNAKCVGNAGETPNGEEDWGGGTRGMSDAGGA